MLQLATPWMLYARQIEALFGNDPEIKVDYNNDYVELTLYVDSGEKAAALEAILPSEKLFGNVAMSISILPSNPEIEVNVLKATDMSAFEKAFKNNPALSYVKHIDVAGFEATYVVFAPDVVQYQADNLADINGFISTLYQDIAYDIFDNHPGIFFCTDKIRMDKTTPSNTNRKEERHVKFPKDEM